MSDSKDYYSEASSGYVENDVAENEAARREYKKSKAREAKHNAKWKANPVDINEVVDRFAPGDKGEKRGVKYIYRGDRFSVVADMAAGYLRVYDSESRSYVKLDGTPGNDEETHFKIKRREEM